MSNVNYIMKNKILIIIALVQFSCIMEIQEPQEEFIKISDFYVNYDQLDNKLFLQVSTLAENDTITNVWVQITGDDPLIEMVFVLNDSANTGDLVSNNGIYSGIFDLQLQFQNYQLKAFVETLAGSELTKIKNLQVEEQYYPELLEVLFFKTYENVCGYELTSNTTYFINDEDLSYLNFQIKIKDYNGLENIESVRYKTTTSWLYADSTGGTGCQCSSSQECVNAPPIFYMSNIASNDSISTFVAINDYIKEPGFKINPISVCNRAGLITIIFTVFDLYFGPVIFPEIELFFSNCSEGDWNSDLDCGHCPEVCGECNN